MATWNKYNASMSIYSITGLIELDVEKLNLSFFGEVC